MLRARDFHRLIVHPLSLILLFAGASALHAQINRGFTGQARAVDTLKKGLAEAQMLTSVDERAWGLRHAFDRVLK